MPKSRGIAPEGIRNPEQILQFRADYCTYVLSFSSLGRFREGSALFLKIVFDKEGHPAY
jgi:hypothetical protein